MAETAILSDAKMPDSRLTKFAIDSLLEIGYIAAAPQGVNDKDI